MRVYEPSPLKTTPRAATIRKLLAYALDPEAGLGEAENAAGKAIRLARLDGMDVEAFGQVFAPPLPSQEPEPEPAACRITVSTGKYAGMTLGDIAEENLSYIAWMSREWKDWAMREAAETVLEYFTAGVA